MLGFVAIAAIAALALAAINFNKVKRMGTGTPLMEEIAGAIREGADAFIHHEYGVIAKIAVLIAILLGVVVAWYTGVAYAGGSVMGLSVGGFALLGLVLVYAVFGVLFKQLDPANLSIQENWIGITFIPFTMTVSGYALGCSVISMFDRVGGGIFTKAADMGADLVGKTEAHIPEDDPRNPAGILVGNLAERYTSFDFKSTQKVSGASREGTALNITQGMAVGMKSVFFPVLVLAGATILANAVAGLFGVATAAIGKGFAIGSAALAALSLFASYLYAQATPGDRR